MGTWKINDEMITLPDVPQNADKNVLFPALFKARPDLEVQFNQDRLQAGLRKNSNAQQEGQPSGNPTPQQLANIGYAQPRSEDEVDQYKQQVYGGNQPAQQVPQQQPSGIPGQGSGLPWQNQPKSNDWWAKRPSPGRGGNPLEYEESPETYGRNEAEKRGASRIGPELMASMMLGPAGKATGVIGRTLGHMATQGGVAAAFHPEDALSHGGTAAGITGALHPISELFGSNNKYARLAKRTLLPLLGGSGSGYVANKAELPYSVQVLATLLGAKGGQKLTSKLMSKEGLMHPTAQKISKHITPEHEKNFYEAKKYGVNHTPVESSKTATGHDVNLIAQANKMGYTPEGASLLQKHKGARLNQDEKALEQLKNKIYKPETEDAIRKKEYSKLKKQEINPKSANSIYKIPKEKWKYEEAIVSEPKFEKVNPKVKLIEPKKYEPEKVKARYKEGFDLVRVPKNPPELIIPKNKLSEAPGLQLPKEKKIISNQSIITPKDKNIELPPQKNGEKLVYGSPKGKPTFEQEGGKWTKPKFKLTEPGGVVQKEEAKVIKEGGWRPPNQKELNASIIRSFEKNGIPLAKKESVRKAMSEVLSNPTWRESLKGINKNALYKNAKFLDLTKRKMHNSYTAAMRAGEEGEAGLIQKAEKSFVRDLEKSIPGYKETRGRHERFKARETLEDLTSKGEMHGKSFFEHFNDKANKDSFIKHVRNVPGGEKDVKALHDIFGRSRDINIEKLASSLPESLTEKSIHTMDYLAKHLMSALKDGDYDKAAIKLVTNEDWPKMVKELEKQTTKEAKLAKFFEYVSKSVSKSKPLNILVSGKPGSKLYADEDED